MSESTEVATVAKDNKAPVLSDAVREFAKMAEIIPASDPEAAIDNIIAQVLAAPNIDSLDEPWRTDDLERLLGLPMEVHELKRMPSDFKDGLGVYLVVKGYVIGDGQEVTFTTGSVAIVAQLVKAYCAGWLPLKCRLVQADRPSSSGYYPQHLEVLRPGDN